MKFPKKAVILTSFSLFFLQAIPLLSQVKFTNPSFESFPATGVAPSGWFACNPSSTPDVQPGQFAVSTAPMQGKTYLGLVCREDGTYEGVGQRLNTPLQSGYCYSFSLFLARSSEYQGYNQTALIRIWGATNSCDKKELLWTSPAISHYEWKSYQVAFSPLSTYSDLILEVYYLSAQSSYRGNILIDNLSEVIQNRVSPISLGNDTTLCVGDKITLSVKTPPTAIIIWSNNSRGSSITVDKQGTYRVDVHYGCAIVSDQITVTLEECVERFKVPNVFTPNGDGVNDSFFIEGLLTKGWRMEVYNRWGKQVYIGEDYQGSWKGENCPTGIYYYVLLKDNFMPIKGWVQVLY